MLKMADFSGLPQIMGMVLQKAKDGFHRWGTREALAEENTEMNERQRSAIAFKAFYFLMTTEEGRKWLLATLAGSLPHTLFVLMNNGLRKAVLEGGTFSDELSGDPQVEFINWSDEELCGVLSAHTGEHNQNLLITKLQAFANARVPLNTEGDNDWKSPVGADAVRAQHAMLDLFQSPEDWKGFYTTWRNMFVGRSNTPLEQRKRLDSTIYGRGIKAVQAAKMSYIPGLFDDRSNGGSKLPASKFVKRDDATDHQEEALSSSPEYNAYLNAAREPGRNTVPLGQVAPLDR
jgi:hypothetical protein